MPTLAITSPARQTKRKVNNEAIATSNWCTLFLYNIPRTSLMITVPGVVIGVSGAAMVAFADRSQSWIDGLSLIALICIVVGGVMTVGGLLYWFFTWCRHKPRLLKGTAVNVKKNSVAPPAAEVADCGISAENSGVIMTAVYTYPAPPRATTNSLANSTVDELETSSEAVFTVP